MPHELTVKNTQLMLEEIGAQLKEVLADSMSDTDPGMGKMSLQLFSSLKAMEANTLFAHYPFEPLPDAKLGEKTADFTFAGGTLRVVFNPAENPQKPFAVTLRYDNADFSDRGITDAMINRKQKSSLPLLHELRGNGKLNTNQFLMTLVDLAELAENRQNPEIQKSGLEL